MEYGSSISVVLPAFNEEQVIERTIHEIIGFLRGLFGDFEIIVIDDGSSDKTAHILNCLKTKMPNLIVITHEKNYGYGKALQSGLCKASKELVLLMDSDGQFSVAPLAAFMQEINSFDAVIGIRSKRRDNLYRYLLGRIGNACSNFILKYRIADINCGFKLFHTEDVKRLKLYSFGGIINCEILKKLLATNKKIRQIPVEHYPRKAGIQTGGKLKTVLRILLEVPNLYRQ